MNITTEQALSNLYSAARMAPLTAEQHDLIRKSGEALAEALKPKTEANAELVKE
jgi:hypothetical protein